MDVPKVWGHGVTWRMLIGGWDFGNGFLEESDWIMGRFLCCFHRFILLFG